MFTYQKTNRFFAEIADGLEPLGERELSALGATALKSVYRGIYFEADRETLYRIHYMSRLVSKIMAQLLRFDCHSTKYLYKTAKKIPWETIFGVGNTFAVSATVTHSKIRHSHYAALCLKDAIVDYFREKKGERPDIETTTPDVRINLHIENNRATINLDTSGGSLHRRGYRKETISAPMQETLAAAIIRLTKWDGEKPLVDPMCGSGTLLAEALMHYCRIPAGFLRHRYGFEYLPEHDEKVWCSVKKVADSGIRELPDNLISGSDADGRAVAAAGKNLQSLPHGRQIRISKKRYQTINAIRDSVIVCNPPYGIRMGRKINMADFMRDFGDFLKQRCSGSTAYIYLGNRDLAKKIGLKATWKKPLKNGGLPGVLAKYELY